jgi:hypothetical protein
MARATPFFERVMDRIEGNRYIQQLCGEEANREM